MKKGFLSTFLPITFLTFLTSTAFACDIHGTTGFMPENNLNISVFDKETNGMTQEKFLAIVDRAYQSYAPIVKEKGATLIMDNKWEDGTVNAYANQIEKEWHVNMFGGLARHTLVTDDGFLLVVCHELGHHIGGAPKYSGSGNAWASNEGQADYFGALKCMKRVLENDDNEAIVEKMNVDKDAVNKCETVYKSANDVALCKRVAMAGKSLALLLGSLGGTSKVEFNTPDRSIVKKTNDAHPKAQCRLDTYFNGILCDKSFKDDLSSKNPIDGACIKKDGYTDGVRPQCWYKPSSAEI